MDEDKGMTTQGDSESTVSNAESSDSSMDMMLEMMLCGGSVQKIDAKGRFTFPKKLRESLGEEQDSIVITMGARLEVPRGEKTEKYRHLWAMPKSEWMKMAKKIKAMPDSRNKIRMTMHFLGGMEICDIDNFGRVLLPAKLRKYAGVECGELFIVGTGEKIIIIDRAVYDTYMDEENYDDLIDEDVDKLGL